MGLGQTGFANTIKLKTLENLCREKGGLLTYDTESEGEAFVANTGDGCVVTFKRCPKAYFPFFKLDDHCNDNRAVMLLQPTSSNMDKFIKKEVVQAFHTRDTQPLWATSVRGA